LSKTFAIIPARWNSARFPGKPLHPIAGKPLVQHVWERCQESGAFDRTIVATDDLRIAQAVSSFGAEVALTSPEHPSGTDRVAEVARQLPEGSLIFNVQGDEPLISPLLLRDLARELRGTAEVNLITAATAIDSVEARNENVVKVVTDRNSNALYFSRSVIPYARDEVFAPYLKHLGIYGYRRDSLLAFVTLEPSSLEQAERLEQLRALQNGMKIRVVVAATRSVGVDTREDADVVEKIIREVPGGLMPVRNETS